MITLVALSALLLLPKHSPQPLAEAWVANAPAVPQHCVVPLKSSALRRTSAVLSASNSSPTALADRDTEESLGSLTMPELKEKLRSLNQKVTGNKSDLIERLLVHQQISNGHVATSNDANHQSELDPYVARLPDPLVDALTRYTSQHADGPPKFMPIQQKSYRIIARGDDAVLFSPTGTGKTLAYVLPLAARLYGWKHDGSLNHQREAQRQRFMKRRNNRNDSFASSQSAVDTANPSILVVEPSRELANQVGKVWAKFHPTATKSSRRHVVTVYGGVPIARHASMLSSKTDVVIGTPGRIRELIREKYLSTSHIRSIVLDEADMLLNFKDNPEVDWLLEGMLNDYQLLLASATINKRVDKFVGEVMELEVGEEGYVTVDADNSASDLASDDGATPSDETLLPNSSNGGVEITDLKNNQTSEMKRRSKKPVVHHWAIAASAASRVALTSDLVITMAPRRGIIFVPSKAEVELVAQQLTERFSTANDVSIHILHGDMVQAARSRAVIAFCGNTKKMTRLLVATDVAARGLDLPSVDLVLQYGVPRVTGKDGTYDTELYTHRTGRAGRYGNARAADAILFYDNSEGEGTTLPKLQQEMTELQGIEIMQRQLPSPSDVMDASYERALRRCWEFESNEAAQSLVQYFVDRLSEDAEQNEPLSLHRLATAMAALSGLEKAVPPRSLLTADPRDRTMRVWTESSSALTPPAVTKVVKALGSGKLGRIIIADDGSAFFDLSAKKAERLLGSVADNAHLKNTGWHFDMPNSM